MGPRSDWNIDLAELLARIDSMDPGGAAADAAEITRILKAARAIALRLSLRFGTLDGLAGIGAVAADEAGADLGRRVSEAAERLAPAAATLDAASGDLAATVAARPTLLVTAAVGQPAAMQAARANIMGRVYSDPMSPRSDGLGGATTAPATGGAGGSPQVGTLGAPVSPSGTGLGTGGVPAGTMPVGVPRTPDPDAGAAVPAGPGGPASPNSGGPVPAGGPAAPTGAPTSPPQPAGAPLGPAPAGPAPAGPPVRATGRPVSSPLPMVPAGLRLPGGLAPTAPTTTASPGAAGNGAAPNGTGTSTAAGPGGATRSGLGAPVSSSAGSGRGGLGAGGPVGARGAAEQERRRPGYLLSTMEFERLVGPMPVAGPPVLGDAEPSSPDRPVGDGDADTGGEPGGEDGDGDDQELDPTL
ncbi:hypothetical protein ACFQNE_08715 [Gordonia phosphorivorans]|uniref:Uncharacterized protein n=1 Tax=Gordonia phosphorivorans TaxID=1056982 RepID=A0ABV6HAE1_9ACTN